jgi:hypothetical protein
VNAHSVSEKSLAFGRLVSGLGSATLALVVVCALSLRHKTIFAMFDPREQQNRIELIITLLAKLYIVLELSPDACPICRKTLTHDQECPIQLAWSLLDAKQQDDARAAIRTLALSIGCDESLADPVTH